MSKIRVDYHGPAGPPGETKGDQLPPGGEKPRQRSLPVRLVRWTLLAVVLAVLPFFLLIRGGVFAYHAWGLGAWPSLLLSAAATMLLLAVYAWGVSRRIGAGKCFRRFLTRAAGAMAAAYVE